MKLGLEKYSYRSGELHLNTRTAIAQEIEDILLNPGADILTLSREQYNDNLRGVFVARGWGILPPIVGRRGRPVSVMDFRKEGVGVQLGLQSTSLDMDILKLQAAYNSEAARIELGVYIVTTTEFQQQLKNLTGKPWTGPTLQAVERKLPTLGRLVEVPICVIGLEVIEVKERFVDLSTMSPTQIKDLAIEFLEEKYNRRIDRDVSEIGKGAEIGFDGIIRLDGMNLVLSIELSKTGGTLRSKLLADSTRSLTDDVREYQKALGRKATLLFVLVGDFSPSYIESVLGDDKIAHGWAEDVDVGYKLFSFDELSDYLESKQRLLRI